MHFAAGRGNISREAYPDLDQMTEDIVDAYQRELKALVEAGCRYVQIDEVPMALLCSEQTRAQMRSRGNDPERMIHELFPSVINRAGGPSGRDARGDAFVPWQQPKWMDHRGRLRTNRRDPVQQNPD
ncbi:MAG: hypothetical protein JO307_17175 [Bryobacterales bacterium]|nr:hypothetical protein [Bryobacterales bacterium]